MENKVQEEFVKILEDLIVFFEKEPKIGFHLHDDMRKLHEIVEIILIKIKR